MFELSRLEAGDIQWSMQRVRLDGLVAETAEAMRAQADAHGVRVSAAVPEHVVVARADPERLQRRRIARPLIVRPRARWPCRGARSTNPKVAAGR